MARVASPPSPAKPPTTSKPSVMPPNSTPTENRADEPEKPNKMDSRDEPATGKGMDIVELDKAGVVQRKWVQLPNKLVQVELPSTAGWLWRSLRSWRDPLFDAFLPVGFPHSVTSDYLAYQTYDSLQAFFSTITSMLANRAILEGLGVGDATTSATYALLLTVLKDAMSRLATIAFAQRFGLAIEPECKSYRFMADLFNDSAFFLDLVGPLLGGVPKVAVLSTAEALRALCGVAAGASKAALSSHFARQDNLAELNAKEASQETAIGLIGLLVGTVVVKFVEDRTTVFCLMVTLVLVHLLMNYLGVRAVTLRTLNRQRATILFEQWEKTGRIATPAEVSRLEAIVLWLPLLQNRNGQLVAVAHYAKNYAAATEGVRDADIVRCERYWIAVRRSVPAKIGILMMEGAEPFDVAMAWVAAVDLARGLDPPTGVADGKSDLAQQWARDLARWRDGLAESGNRSATTWDSKMRARMEEAGWDLSNTSFETAAPVRIRASPQEKKEQ